MKKIILFTLLLLLVSSSFADNDFESSYFASCGKVRVLCVSSVTYEGYTRYTERYLVLELGKYVEYGTPVYYYVNYENLQVNVYPNAYTIFGSDYINVLDYNRCACVKSKRNKQKGTIEETFLFLNVEDKR